MTEQSPHIKSEVLTQRELARQRRNAGRISAFDQTEVMSGSIRESKVEADPDADRQAWFFRFKMRQRKLHGRARDPLASKTRVTRVKRDRVRVGYKPSDYGRVFHKSTCRVRILCWGIKGGKTYAGAIETARYASTNANKLVWIVAPIYKQAINAERELVRILRMNPGFIVNHNRSEHIILLKNGTMIEVKTAENPDRLRGPNVDFAWIDEGAFCSVKVFMEVRKRTAARRGLIIITTTPNGKNWVYEECLLAGMPIRAPYGEYTSPNGDTFVSHRPTWDFAWVPRDELEWNRARMTEGEFLQEWGAMFTARINAAFPKITQIYTKQPHIRVLGEKHCAGLDLAKQQDFTVLTIMNSVGRVVKSVRMQKIRWKQQLRRLVRVMKEWLVTCVCVDASSVGSYMIEDLKKSGINVFAVDFNNYHVKREVIQLLQHAIEHKYVKIAHPRSEDITPEGKVLIDELEDYTARITEGGRISFSATKGRHDDAVVALALAFWGKVRGLAGGTATAQDAKVGLEEKIRQKTIRRREELRQHHRRLPMTMRRTAAGFSVGNYGFWRNAA